MGVQTVSLLSFACDPTLGEKQKAPAVPQHSFLTQALWKQVTTIRSCMSTSGIYSRFQFWEVLATPPDAPDHCLVCSRVLQLCEISDEGPKPMDPGL